MSKKSQQILILIVLAFVVGFLLYQVKNRQAGELSLETQQTELTQEEKPNQEQAVKQTEFSFTAESDEQSALELVQNQVELTLKEYSFGTMVEGVNGLMADEGHFWALYQNGEFAQTGLKEIILQAGDTIKLKYEEIVL